MSNQIVITSGAKVRELNDVIIGTSGVLSSLAFNVANGVPKLDSNAKILVSQLPNSVMEYQGTWNAATNTPTLTNGGAFNQGDVYLCNVAGTTNFGAGPISFIVGDSAIYSGSIWQRSGGATGSVTSVGLSTDGNAITIGNSPITTSGTITANFAGTSGQYINGAGNLTTFPTLLSSVGLSMPSAFSVSNSPLTANGTIAVTGAGYPSQYIRGDGTLADFPTSGGGGSSVSYYLNGGTSQGTIGGVTYYEMSKTADTGTGVDFPKTGDGLIVSFLTDAGDPAQLNIPAGNWNYEIYASMSANGGTPQMYAELYVYNGTTFTLIATSSNEILYDGVNLNLYTFAMTVPATTLTLTDRLAVKLYATNSGGKTTTVHTQDSHLCQIITTFSTGITALNGLTAQVQYFATGTSGSDFNISSVTATHTFNLPTASATNRGALSSADWTTFNSKVGGSGSDGRVAFWNGASTLSSNANLYWDNSTSRLGIGTNTPNASLGIVNSSSTGLQLRTSDTSNQYQANIYWDSSYGMVYGYNRIGSGTTANNITFYNSLGGFISVPESSNNNIGFNTINPQGLAGASVYDFTSLNTNVELRLHNSSTGYTSSDGSYIRVTSTALVIANAETSKSILINNGGNGVVTIDGTNKVAIGDIGVIPMTQQLTVVGSIEAYGGSIYQTVTSSMLKANASGQIIAAVGGTDYEYPLTFSSPLVRTTNTISMPAASTSVSGYLTSTDWNTFNNKGNGTVTSVSATAPVVSSGGATPNISMAAATTSVSGYLTSTDWNTFNGKFTLPSLTQGSILFSNGSTIAQNNSKLYWDNTNMRLGIGTQSVAQYVTYIQANTATNANAWVAIDNPNTTGSTALRLILNGSTTSGFQYVQSTNMTQVYANAGDIQLINGSSLGLTIANTTGAGTFSSSVTATSFVKSGGTSSQFLKADGSVDSNSYYLASNPSGFTSNTGTVTSVATSAPLTGGTITTSGTIGITQATTSTNGYLSSTDWNTFNNKTTLPSLTSGSVLFSNGSTIAQDNANFYWDDTNNRLGIGTSAPASILHILGASATLIIDGNSAGTQTNAFLRLRTGGFNVGNFAYNLATDNIQISNVSGGSGGGVQIFGTGGSTTGITVVAGGNVGIGTTIPSGIVNGGGLVVYDALYPRVILQNSTTGTSTSAYSGMYMVGNNMYVQNPLANLYFGTLAGSSVMAITSGGNVNVQSGNVLNIYRTDNTRALQLYTTANECVIDSWQASSEPLHIRSYGSSGRIQFFTNAAERLQIRSDGSMVHKAYNAGEAFLLNFNGSSALYGFANYNNGNITVVNSGVANVGFFNMTTGAYVATSDINKKKDFEDSTIGLQAILGLKPKLFRMKTEDESVEKQLGFIAQEVKDFIPQAYAESVTGDELFVGLQDRPIIAALVKAVQELEARIKQLENK